MATRLSSSGSLSPSDPSPVPDSRKDLPTSPGTAETALRANGEDAARASYEHPAEPLRKNLLGEVGAGWGLIHRVKARVAGLASSGAPSFRTGSYIPTGGSSHDQESEDDGLIAKVSELCIALVEWEAAEWDEDGPFGKAPLATRQALLRYLRSNGITDVDYLTNPEGKLAQIRHKVREMLPSSQPPTIEAQRRCQILSDYLTAWLNGDDHVHDFQRRPGDEGVNVMECECGASFTLYPGTETWFAAG